MTFGRMPIIPAFPMDLGMNSSSRLPLALPGSPAAVFSAVRLSSWSGSFAQVARVSDSVTFDIPFKNNVPDVAATVAFAGGSALLMPILYDQSGNGNHLVEAVGANMPSFSATAMVNGIAPVIFDGLVLSVIKKLNIPASLSLTRNDFSAFMVMRPGNSICWQGFWEFNNGATQLANIISLDPGLDDGVLTYDGALYLTGIRPRSQMMTSALRSGAASQIFTVNGQSSTKAASSAATMNGGGYVGSASFSTQYAGVFDLFALVFYPTAVNDATHDAVQGQFNSAFAIPQSFTTRLIYGGNSLVYGVGSTLNQILTRKVAMPPQVEMYNLGIPGIGIASQQASFTTREQPLYDAAKAANIIICCDASNDFNAATFSSSADAISQATALYNIITLALVGQINALGSNAKALVPTVCSRTGFDTTTNWKETARTTYNTLVRNGAVANNYTLLDRAANSAFAAQNACLDTTYYSPDATHPNDTGYSVIAAIDRAVILPLLL